MFQDFKELLSLFNANDVKYLVVGGYAVSFHAQPRATKDLDILIKADSTNAVAVFKALASFGSPLEGLSPESFIEKGMFYRMGHPPLMVDIMSEISGVDFDEAWKKKVEVDIDEGLKALFIDTDSLMASKIAAGRDGDQDDIKALRAAQKTRNSEQT